MEVGVKPTGKPGGDNKTLKVKDINTATEEEI